MSKKTLAIQYWPSVSWVKQLYTSTEVEIEQWGTYQKQSHFNRCRMIGVNGPLTLSVPLVGGREQKAFERDILIDNSQRWAVQHLRTLQSGYAKAPYFDYYFPVVESLLLKQSVFMMALNQSILQQLVAWLQWPGQLSFTTQFQRNKVVPGAAGEVLPPYVQVFSDKHPFVANLSVLDALFCLGPRVKDYLTQ